MKRTVVYSPFLTHLYLTGEKYPQFKGLLLDLQLNHIQLPPRVVENGEKVSSFSSPSVQDDFIDSAALTYVSHNTRSALQKVTKTMVISMS